MNDFVAYYWTPELLVDHTLAAALQRLTSERSNPTEKEEAFRLLLQSDSAVAQGIAFDVFSYAESLHRFGLGNPFHGFSAELLTRARSQLQEPPIVGRTSDGKSVFGANQASASGVLAILGQEQDIDLIVPILASTHDVQVVYAACLALQYILGKTNHYYPQLLAALERVINHSRWPQDVRVRAVRSLANYEIPEVEDLLVKVSQTALLPISAYAAGILGQRNLKRYRNLLEDLSSKWPANARYPVTDVRDMLTDDRMD